MPARLTLRISAPPDPTSSDSDWWPLERDTAHLQKCEEYEFIVYELVSGKRDPKAKRWDPHSAEHGKTWFEIMQIRLALLEE